MGCDSESKASLHGWPFSSSRLAFLEWICTEQVRFIFCLGPILAERVDVFSGSRSGAIHHHDVRVAEHLVGTLNGHTQVS